MILRLFSIFLFFLFFSACQQKDSIDFNADVRPILQKKCLACHGGIKQAGGFGLVFRENALKQTESGNYAIIPGDPKNSEIIKRISHTNPELRMPLDALPLTEQEIDLLKTWIKEGAKWAEHWAYIPPETIDPPKINSNWANNEMDHFAFAKLEENHLQPSPQADKATLLRRVSLDLTGLPPTPSEMQQFLDDDSKEAFAKSVDRLLASPQFGEHWASMWLDLARFADSKGYERDPLRQIWQYRDWVIDAFNQDMPFDQFTIEQLAGDLLPNPTREQMIATGFHRNTMSNDEGGTYNEEFRIAAVVDRVNTTMEVWQGTTMACVQCHSHPYDPFKHKEFYEFYSFFNNTSDFDHVTESPYLITYKEEDQQKLNAIKKWIQTHADDKKLKQVQTLLNLHEPKIPPTHFTELKNAKFINRADEDYVFMNYGGHFKLEQVALDNITHLLLKARYRKKEKAQVAVRLDTPNGKIIGSTMLENKGWGLALTNIPIESMKGKHDLYITFEGQKEGERAASIFAVLLAEDLPGQAQIAYDSIHAYYSYLLNAKDSLRSPVMFETPKALQRKTHIFERGNWLVKGEEVTSNVPDILNPMADDLPRNRLGMAKWLVAKDNPLTARVVVNRFWAQLFGIGIIETIEDLGTQSSSPSHPKLLDYLAVKFSKEMNWSVKELLRYIVSSATYQQSSKFTPELLELDPKNRLLARGPRVRLSAEQIRDQALHVCGLLSKKMHGPSVMPPQPENIWQSTVYSNLKWATSEGEDRYRRGIYTLLRRSAPYPSMMTFDGSTREFCVSRRINTNTPLQALVTLNDPVYLEAAQALAKKMVEKKGEVAQQLSSTYEQILYKEIKDSELKQLKKLYEDSIAYYQENPTEVEAITSETGTLSLAAMTVVANAMLNLDEFITKS